MTTMARCRVVAVAAALAFALPASALTASAPPPSRVLPMGSVLRVGAGQPFVDVAAALSVASDGDLVLVDPGAYPPFDVNALGVTILSSSGAAQPYTIVAPAGVPAVRVRNLGPGQLAAVGDFVVAWTSGASPAVSIEQCAGTVNLQAATIAAGGNLTGSAARGAVEIVGCATVWCTRLDVSAIATGSTTAVFPALPNNTGLSAVFADNSSLLLDRPTLRGLDNNQFAGGVSFGGDALRLTGGCHVSFVVDGPGLTRLVGGNGALFGGSCVHHEQTTVGLDSDYCGFTQLAKGRGSTAANAGGYLAVNNDRGIVQLGPGGTTERFLVACLLEAAGDVTAPARVAIGTTAQIAVNAFLPRQALLAMSFSPRMTSIAGVSGRAAFDWFQADTFLLASGALPATGAVVAVPIPNAAVLQGVGVALQAGFGPPASAPSLLSLSIPAFVVLE